jgi:hypothetical protein
LGAGFNMSYMAKEGNGSIFFSVPKELKVGQTEKATHWMAFSVCRGGFYSRGSSAASC